MKIAFDKVGTTPRSFALTQDAVHFEGSLAKTGSHQIVLEGKLHGSMTLECDRCGAVYNQPLEESLTLQVSDRVVQDKEDLDIIEFLDGMIDLMYVLQSETNALAGDYHFCPTCAASDETLEIEF